MRKFAIKLVIFLILVKLIDSSLYSFFSWAQQPQIGLEEDYGSLNRMYQGLINTDIVFVGSSRTYLHINPEIIQKATGHSAWNIGMDGTNFEQHKFMLEEYLLHNSLPQIIVLEADLELLDTHVLTFKTYLFLPYRNRSSHTLELFDQNWEDKLGYWFFSSSIYKHQISRTISNSKIIWDGIKNQGFAAQKPNSLEIVKANNSDCAFINGACLKAGQNLAELPQKLPAPPTDYDLTNMNERKKGFEELSKLAEDKGFTLVLFTPPYLSGTTAESTLKIASDFYSDLAQKYKHTHYLSYANSEAVSAKLDLWWNTGHLNLIGANLFSEQIGKTLNQYLPTAP